MELRDILTFLMVAETKKLSAAAEAMYCSVPTLSVRIKNLESELGTQLFNRTPSGIVLTKAGEEFLPFARKGTQIIQTGQQRVHSLINQISGSLSIVSTHYCSIYYLPQILDKIKGNYADIQTEVEVYIKPLAELQKMIKSENADFGIVHTQNFDTTFGAVEIARTYFVLCVYPEHPLAQHQFVELDDFKDEPLIFYSKGSQTAKSLMQVFEYYGIQPNISIMLNTGINDVELIKEMVMHKFGIAIIPQDALTVKNSQNFIKAIPIKGDLMHDRKIYIIYDKNHVKSAQNSYCQKFLELFMHT